MLEEPAFDVRDKIALCRVIHFYRICESLTARAAIERINAERPPEQHIPFDAASEWYLAYAIGREEEAEEEGRPNDAYVGLSYAWSEDPTGAPLIRALAYEAELKMELRELLDAAPTPGAPTPGAQASAKKAAAGSGEIHRDTLLDIDGIRRAQVDGIRRALQMLDPIIADAWRQRVADTRAIANAEPGQ